VPIPDGVVVDRLDRIVACVGMEKEGKGRGKEGAAGRFQNSK